MTKAGETAFRVGLGLKLIDSVFEVIGGGLFLFPSRMARWMLLLAHHEIYRHHNALAGKLDNLAQVIQFHGNMGEAAYLVVHGASKVVLIAAVFMNKKWGYLGLIGVLSFFALVEVSEGIMQGEIVVGALALVDIFLVFLMVKEYRERFLAPAAPEEA